MSTPQKSIPSFQLSDQHATASFGVPVLEDEDGRAYGPRDAVTLQVEIDGDLVDLSVPAGEMVFSLYRGMVGLPDPDEDSGGRDRARRFLASDPGYSQAVSWLLERPVSA